MCSTPSCEESAKRGNPAGHSRVERGLQHAERARPRAPGHQHLRSQRANIRRGRRKRFGEEHAHLGGHALAGQQRKH